ncbi:MAG: hypothetical protein KF752_09030 [Pirellulaceae bacterium]|nr:hypothetical protein [Pirellulaceae bacterium]
MDRSAAGVKAWSGKRDEDRVTLLPATLHKVPHAQLAKVREWHEIDFTNGYLRNPRNSGPQERPGVMINTHVVRDLTTKARSTWDDL